MNRKYDTQGYAHAVALLREHMKSVAVTTDMIVGFPQETEEDFLQSYDFAKKMGFAKIHVFPYSPKKGTPAASMTGQLPNAVKNQRSQKLMQLSNVMAEAFLKKFLHNEMPVLYERAIAEDMYEGHTTNYIKVHGKSTSDVTNSIVNTTINEIKLETAMGFVTKL